jgi:hypothetical protein
MKTTMIHIAQRLRSRLRASFFHHDHIPQQPIKASTVSSEATLVDQKLRGEALTLATQLRGKTLHLSDMTRVLAAWPSATNKYTEELKELVDSLLERIVTNERKLKALKQADFARLMSL